MMVFKVAYFIKAKKLAKRPVGSCVDSYYTYDRWSVVSRYVQARFVEWMFKYVPIVIRVY